MFGERAVGKTMDVKFVKKQFEVQGQLEAFADCVQIPQIILPDNNVLRNISILWANTIGEEISLLFNENSLVGKPEDYEMQLTTPDETLQLIRDKIFEDYQAELLKNCTLALVPKSDFAFDLPELGVKPKSGASS